MTTQNMKIKRLTMNDLQMLVENTAKRIISESNSDKEIKLAQKELVKMGTSLSGVGLRLQGTPFQRQYQRIYDEIVKLNNALISHIKGSRQ